MSCGGKTHEFGNGTMGALYTCVASHGLDNGIGVADARKIGHDAKKAMAAEAKKAGVSYPTPSRKDVVTHLRREAARMEYRRDHPLNGELDTGNARAVEEWNKRWNGYRDNYLGEAEWHAKDPNSKLPDGVTFAVWQQMPQIMKEHRGQNTCETCRKYVSPYGGNHACKGPAAAKSAAKPAAPVADLRDADRAKQGVPSSAAPEPEAQPYDPDTADLTGIKPRQLKVADLRQLIVDKQREAYDAGQASARMSTDAPTQAIPVSEPEQPASRMDRVMERLGRRKCPDCGQWASIRKGHPCPATAEPEKLWWQDAPTAEVPPVTGDAPTAVLPPTGDDFGQPIGGPVPVAPGNTFGPQTTMRDELKGASVSGLRLLSRFGLNPRGWRLMAPYAFRAALIVAPVVLLAGGPLGPIAWAASAFFMYRGRKWLQNRPYEDTQALIEHYEKPWWFQNGNTTMYADSAPTDYVDYAPPPAPVSAPASTMDPGQVVPPSAQDPQPKPKRGRRPKAKAPDAQPQYVDANTL